MNVVNFSVFFFFWSQVKKSKTKQKQEHQTVAKNGSDRDGMVRLGTRGVAQTLNPFYDVWFFFCIFSFVGSLSYIYEKFCRSSMITFSYFF